MTSTVGIVLVVLKLTGNIDWHWAWVTLPFWGVFALVLCLFILFAVLTTLGIALGPDPSKAKTSRSN